MTEDEARTKICPLLLPAPVISENCIASGCMAWRWSAMALDHGYCGLAGSGTGLRDMRIMERDND